MTELRHVEWGIANYFPDEDIIEVHKELIKYPKLYYPILKHEVGHDDSIFNLKDFKHDLLPTEKVDQFELFKFMFKHPKTFTQLLPLTWSLKRGLIVDINMSIIYSIFFAGLAGAYYLIKNWVGF